jgi:3-hydroxy-9,10-secoandrosta-1,3,5(10)-triene-9,17-dione monooxygenase reductase component
MRAACGCFATGVTAVCSRDADGVHGMTVNSFTSVSLEPPLVLFCTRPDSRVLAAIERSGAFTVNVLAADQAATSTRLAQRGVAAKMRAEATAPGTLDAPRIAHALAAFDCALERTEPGGDHLIVLGRVLAVEITPPQVAAPLLFYRGSYRMLGPR